MSISIREACINDAQGIATVHLLTWQKSFRGLFPDDKLDTYSIEETTQKWVERIKSYDPREIRLLVADDPQHGIVGFATGGKAGWFEEESKFDCEIFAIYVMNEYQRRGIGVSLARDLLQFFLENGWRSMIIWTLKLSPYRKFYEKFGGIPKETKVYEKWDTQQVLWGYTWENIKEIPIVTSV